MSSFSFFGAGSVLMALVQGCCRSPNSFCAAAVCRKISDKAEGPVYF